MSTEKSKETFLLSDKPSDDEIQRAVEWISSRKSSNRAAMKLLEKLMGISQAGPCLSALTEWMSCSKSWTCLENSAYGLVSLEHLDWILSLLRKKPQHPQAGIIWHSLLSNYINIEIIEGATDWFLEFGERDQHSDSVAATLVNEVYESKIIGLSRQILEKRPQSFLLAAALLREAPEPRTVEIGIAILENSDPIIGGIVVGALARSGPEGKIAAENFLNKHRETKRFDRILDGFLYDNPELARPYLLEWVSKHPKSPNTLRTYVDLQTMEECEQRFDSIVSFELARKVAAGDLKSVARAKDWLSTRSLEGRWSSRQRSKGEVIEALLTKLPGDEFVVKEAERWLQKLSLRNLGSLYQRVNALYNQYR